MSRREIEDDVLEDFVSDGEALALVTDGVLRASSQIREQSRKVRKAQDKLRKMVKPKAWALYLQLESLTNDRASMEQELLVKWAFTAGTRSMCVGSKRRR
jgi:hypothetical protein